MVSCSKYPATWRCLALRSASRKVLLGLISSAGLTTAMIFAFALLGGIRASATKRGFTLFYCWHRQNKIQLTEALYHFHILTFGQPRRGNQMPELMLTIYFQLVNGAKELEWGVGCELIDWELTNRNVQSKLSTIAARCSDHSTGAFEILSTSTVYDPLYMHVLWAIYLERSGAVPGPEKLDFNQVNIYIVIAVLYIIKTE